MMMKTDLSVTSGEQCYCGSIVLEACMFTCTSCKRLFHIACLKSRRPSPLEGDIFFHFVCMVCSESKEEEFDRMKLQWLHVVMLSLYNLQLTGMGKYGYFRWKEHICAFIDKHWTTFFGLARKKTNLWYGTVAGTLSSGCPNYFLSGANELSEPGWWRLSEIKPPSLKIDAPGRLGRRVKVEAKEPPLKVDSLRSRRGKTSIAAAMELKAKRSTLTESKDLRKKPAAKGAATDPGVGSEENSSSSEVLSSSSKCPTSISAVKVKHDETELSTRSAGEVRSSSPMAIGQPVTDPIRRPVSAPLSVSHSHILWEHQIKTEIQDTSLDGAEVGSLSRDSSMSGMEFGSSGSQPAPSTHSSQCGGLSRPELLDEDTNSQFSHSSSRTDRWLTEKDLWSIGTIPQCLMKDDEQDDSDSELEIDPGTFSPLPGSPIRLSQSPSIHEMLSSMDNSSRTSLKMELSLEEPHTLSSSLRDEEEDDTESVVSSVSENSSRGSSDEDSGDDASEVSKTTAQRLYRKRKSKDEEPQPEKIPEPRCIPMSEYEERQLLKKLNQVAETVKLEPDLCRLRRKLIVRQQKREHGQPLFNLDYEVNKLLGNISGQEQMNFGSHPLNRFNLPMSQRSLGESRVLDRFQVCHYHRKSMAMKYSSFLNRLVGTEDSQLQSICSPYTARMLKPFIRRDYESKPLKLRLLEEVQAYPYRNDPDWVMPPSSPIDYCYVRPQHIPSVNTLCQEFFWPGIDLSECLQYPDFSCVVVYRKVVVGFAFMVPDIKYNEAYISFIFTHPEWRQAGIATFMLYHLIQTCMGKDVTLHVSATNPAMLLYQKFGFKPEEFILDFYDKYYPENLTVCKHAFMLRLRR